MTTPEQMGPNFGVTIRIKQGGTKVLVTEMSDAHVLNYQHLMRATIWHCDTYKEAYLGNIKSKEEALRHLEITTNEINWRKLKQRPLIKDYIKQLRAGRKIVKTKKTKAKLLTKKEANKLISKSKTMVLLNNQIALF